MKDIWFVGNLFKIFYLHVMFGCFILIDNPNIFMTLGNFINLWFKLYLLNMANFITSRSAFTHWLFVTIFKFEMKIDIHENFRATYWRVVKCQNWRICVQNVIEMKMRMNWRFQEQPWTKWSRKFCCELNVNLKWWIQYEYFVWENGFGQ